jgi:hypothetical protein
MNQQPPTPIIGLAQAPPAEPVQYAATDPQVGEQWYAKLRGAVNAQWQMTTIVQTTSGVGAQFPDGVCWLVQDIELGGKVSQTEVTPPAPKEAALKPAYAAFSEHLVKLEGICLTMFGVPLQVLLNIIDRNAASNGLPVAGTMEKIDNVHMVVPDGETFEAWVTAYLLAVQKREAEQAATV